MCFSRGKGALSPIRNIAPLTIPCKIYTLGHDATLTEGNRKLTKEGQSGISYLQHLATRDTLSKIQLLTVAMRFSSTACLLAFGALLGTAAAHNIQLGAHGRECFHEQLHKSDYMTVTFQVGDREFQGAGNLDIDFWVSRTYRNK